MFIVAKVEKMNPPAFICKTNAIYLYYYNIMKYFANLKNLFTEPPSEIFLDYF